MGNSLSKMTVAAAITMCAWLHCTSSASDSAFNSDRMPFRSQSRRRRQGRGLLGDPEIDAYEQLLREQQRAGNNKQAEQIRRRLQEFKFAPSDPLPGGKDYYEWLDVPQNADANAITRAAKKKALEFHPDKYQNADQQTQREMVEKMKLINLIKDTLINERSDYDRVLQEERGRPNRDRKVRREEEESRKREEEETRARREEEERRYAEEVEKGRQREERQKAQHRKKVQKTRIYGFDGKLEYVGEVNERGEYHGQGTAYWLDEIAENYVGMWQNGKRNGQGTEYWLDGIVTYVGMWRDGKRHGQGTEFGSDGTVRYVGEWQDNERHGQGSELGPDETVESVREQDGERLAYAQRIAPSTFEAV